MDRTDRDYSNSHPWITFQLNLRDISPMTWMLLGEVKSKCDHIANSILRPEYAHHLLELFLAKGAHATTAIEGNTLGEEEALEAVRGELEVPQSQEYLAQEIRNILDAANEIKDGLISHDGPTEVSPERIKRFNQLVLKNLPLEEHITPGQIRDYPVVVGNIYKGPPATDCGYLLSRLCEWLNTSELDTDDAFFKVPYAIVKAIIAHLYIAWIHPFGDGNGRTARLIEVQILLAAELPAPTAHLLSNHYNCTRSEYYRQLKQAGQTGNPLPFIDYAINGFVDELQGALTMIREQQFTDRWEQFVYETFGELKTEPDRRRLRLVLDLSKQYNQVRKPIPKANLRRLTPRLAEAYANKTSKTLTRDLNTIIQMGLIEKVGSGFEPRDWLILAFRPERRKLSTGKIAGK